ncbi:zinc finger protein 836-like, partial [Aricia agestis]|uniref:zinc finger protein 836-like n=1 Tax=Aricia agestis TaxID=91739 RepID=UPI001C209EBF
KDLVTVTEALISSVENNLSINFNDSGNIFYAVDGTTEIQTTNEINSNLELAPELYVLQTNSPLNYEPTLLDDHTVNQFLLPSGLTTNEKTLATNESSLLALHTCVMCQEIFTNEADLLDHAIFAHTTPVEQKGQEAVASIPAKEHTFIDGANSSINFECEWLVCTLCERVLSTALESEPDEQLCCLGQDSRSRVCSRRLSIMFVCDGCKYLFATGEALDKHKLICFVDEPLYTDQVLSPIESYPQVVPSNSCNTCSDSDHTGQCQPRARRHNSNKMWNCGSCNQLFVSARELYRHKRGEDRPEGAPLTAYVCDECDKVLGSMCALHTHRKMHRNTKPGYPCRVCGRRFNQSGHLAIHMRMHTGERPYPCDLCSKAFKVKVERDDHRRTHTGERPFACAACPKTFTAAARLREHARIHTDHRPYKCEICGAAFRRPYARTVHTLIHTGEKPHECDVCHTAFRRSGDMWKHKRTQHGIIGN